MQKTTQQRKAESAERDRRPYNETSKAARKGVARKKRHRNRAERRLAHASFGPEIVDDPDAESLASARVLRKHRTVSRTTSDVPAGLLSRALLASNEMMAFASKTLRQLLGRAAG